MNRLSKKFIIGISIIMLSILFLSLNLNSHFIGRYFLYQEKRDLKRICDGLIAGRQEEKLTEAIKQAELSEDVLLIRVAYTDDNILLNQRLRNAFLEKGLGMDVYWLWDQDQLTTLEHGRKLRVYSQEKLHYSILVEYLSMGEEFIAAAKIVPATLGTITLVNRVTGIVFFAATVITLLLVAFLIRRITNPLVQIGQAARSIANLDFQHLEIKTGDELEILADDMNEMSDKLAEAHLELKDKNRQMESLLSNVSHDLKTPVSLIKAYADGIKDGIDDGTFLDTIIRQNNRMQMILEQLLEYAKIAQKPYPKENCSLSELLFETLDDYEVKIKESGLILRLDITEGGVIGANPEAIRSIFDNLISNAMKYGCGEQIFVSLKKQEGHWIFTLCNDVDFDHGVVVERLWEPFYVMDKSRNSNLSGTGLGLSIVRASALRYGYTCDCRLIDDRIEFVVSFPES